jgi:kynurenine formamidase
VVDLTDGQGATAPHATTGTRTESRTHIIAPGALIPGTWSAGQIPPERLVAPLVMMDLNPATKNSWISLDDIAAWESRHGMIPQGAVIAIRRADDAKSNNLSGTDVSITSLPVTRDAAMFLIEARYAIGFAVETPVNLSSDRTLARQLALHGNYVVERAARFTSVPATGSLVIVAPAMNKKSGEASVRVLAMVR